MKIQRKHLVLASLVLALSAAVYINWQLSSNADTTKAKELGKATYVNSNISATVDEVSEFTSRLTKDQQNYFSNARLKRDKTGDEVKSIALEALSSVENDDDMKEEALAQLALVEEQLMNQVSVENTLIAKGFSDCVCSISDTSVTVVVPESEMGNNSPLIIKDVVTDVTNIPFENINIVTV
ncbi:MAG: SpoIIIAH-like family protein [Clostridia bacterium]|nr:SpoIIIAH-like family protein [Clostridia bacterium]